MENVKKPKVVLISGFTGQDGANLTKYLLENTDVMIYGMVRRSANPNYKNVKEFLNNPRVKTVYGDLTDYFSIEKLVREIQPDYLINLGANSFVGCSWDMPVQVFEANTLGVLYCLEAIRLLKPDCRFYQAGSSEQFGDVIYSPQDINHPFRPRSPYGASKCSAHHLVKVYRDSYNLYAVTGILFNHEGTKRGPEFVTRKITLGIARIKHALDNGGDCNPIELGNLDSRRDWSDSEDFVEGIWLMMNQDKPKDYILSSNETHSVREFITMAFECAGIKGRWHQMGDTNDPLQEIFIADGLKQNLVLVMINPRFYRPAEVELLLGDSTPAREELGWKPRVSFQELVSKMVTHDLKTYKKNQEIQKLLLKE